MAKANNIAFRSALSGYNREDVNRYILNINQQLEEKDALLKKNEEEAASLQSSLKAECDKAVLQRDEAAEKLREAENLILALRQEKDALAEQMEKETERAAKAEEEREEALLKIRELEKNCTENSDCSAQKSQKYDQISAQIGDILINANQSADNILTSAHTEASRIVSETEKEANYIRTRLSDTADEMLSSISSQLHVSTENCVTELMTAVKEMHDSADSLVRDLQARSRELSDRIGYYQSTVTENIESALAEMDQKYGIRKK